MFSSSIKLSMYYHSPWPCTNYAPLRTRMSLPKCLGAQSPRLGGHLTLNLWRHTAHPHINSSPTQKSRARVRTGSFLGFFLSGKLGELHAMLTLWLWFSYPSNSCYQRKSSISFYNVKKFVLVSVSVNCSHKEIITYHLKIQWLWQ